MTPTRCHKCKDSACFIYPTRAPVCGPCLYLKVEAAFVGPLRRALRGSTAEAKAIVVDYSKNPQLLKFFLTKCQDMLSTVSEPISAPTVEYTEQVLSRSLRLLSVEQRRRLTTQLRLAAISRLANGGILIQSRSATTRASDVFNHLLAGELIVTGTYAGFQSIPLLGDLEPSEIAALEHHISGSTEPFIYEPERMNDGWLHNTERSSEMIIEKFMKSIPPEMPSAISNVNATVKKMQAASGVALDCQAVCQLCSIRFTNFEANWLPTGLSEINGLCHLCCIACQKLDLAVLKQVVDDLCT